jgi:7-keto-8-aminopelargonate synthetase-like enzyme
MVSSGYVTNVAVTQALAGRFTHAFIDSRAHVSLLDAALFLGCPIIQFEHQAVRDLSRKMRGKRRSLRPMVITDGMFSHNGSVAPLRAYVEILPPHGGLLVDDAHGAAVLGRQGQGSAELAGVNDARLVRTITLSKAFGVYGGVILGSAEVRSLIHGRSRVFVGNTPLPPALAAAALAALHLVRSRPGMRTRLRHNIQYLRQRIRQGGVPLEDEPGPILGIRPRRAESRAKIDRALLEREILPPFMQYPGGAEDGFYRFAVSSEHRRVHLRAVAEALLSCREEWEA